jgi:hypothetical protein
MSYVGNGASSAIFVDGSSVGTGSDGAPTPFGIVYFFSDAFSETTSGAICETGWNASAFTGTDATNMYINQHTYWGF